ncbi:MAG: filamentous hemagglutinin N-terminal domain-containing protein, partial [Deltaproteobacteria bacterium]|nr:filamentous hemagglutinin N-terminal domain-containing protein [Deltaproteobacteria bacterium]
EYTLVRGSLTDAASGESEALTGHIQLQYVGQSLDDTSTLAVIDDFELQAGDQTFLPSLPLEYEGLRPNLFLQQINAIRFDEHGVTSFNVRSGGELVEANDEEVTFRFFDFQAFSPRLGPFIAQSADSELPRRFQLEGTLYQVDQTFRIPDDDCEPIVVEPPPPDGGVIITRHDGASLFHSFESYDVSGAEPAEFVEPGRLRVPLSRVSGGISSSIDGHLVGDASVIFINPAGVSLDGQTLTLTSGEMTPTLEELHIRAPDGAEVTIDDDGLLTVESSGDLYLEGSIPALPGVVRIRIVAGGSITATEDFEVQGVTLELYAGGHVELPGGIIDPPVIGPICDIFQSGLRPVFPSQRTELGTFSMVASAADQAVEIDVLPRQKHNRLRLGSRQPVRVVLFGSEDLDVSEIDRSSLRLGPAQGEPITRAGRSIVFRRLDVNRDGRGDLFAVFKLSELGIAYGDTELCLSAETRAGVTLEGCDTIDTLHRWPRWRWSRQEYKFLRGVLGRAR